MSATLIIDCSITMSWCFPDEAATESLKVYDRLPAEIPLVPSHWFLEVANVLALAEKRKRIPPAKSTAFLAMLSSARIEVDPETAARAFEDILPLCRTHGLTSYDAAYLELAARRQLPLASLDDELRAAAKKIGIKLLGK